MQANTCEKKYVQFWYSTPNQTVHARDKSRNEKPRERYFDTNEIDEKKSRFFYLAALDVLLNGCRQGWTRLFCFLLFARAFGSHFNGKRQLFLLFALSLSILRARLVPTPVQLEHIDSNVGWWFLILGVFVVILSFAYRHRPLLLWKSNTDRNKPFNYEKLSHSAQDKFQTHSHSAQAGRQAGSPAGRQQRALNTLPVSVQF